jgi:hypothetical protein
VSAVLLSDSAVKRKAGCSCSKHFCRYCHDNRDSFVLYCCLSVQQRHKPTTHTVTHTHTPGMLARLAWIALLLNEGRCDAFLKMLLWGTTVTRGLDVSSQEGTCPGRTRHEQVGCSSSSSSSMCP